MPGVWTRLPRQTRSCQPGYVFGSAILRTLRQSYLTRIRSEGAQPFALDRIFSNVCCKLDGHGRAGYVRVGTYKLISLP